MRMRLRKMLENGKKKSWVERFKTPIFFLQFQSKSPYHSHLRRRKVCISPGSTNTQGNSERRIMLEGLKLLTEAKAIKPRWSLAQTHTCRSIEQGGIPRHGM